MEGTETVQKKEEVFFTDYRSVYKNTAQIPVIYEQNEAQTESALQNEEQGFVLQEIKARDFAEREGSAKGSVLETEENIEDGARFISILRTDREESGKGAQSFRFWIGALSLLLSLAGVAAIVFFAQ